MQRLEVSGAVRLIYKSLGVKGLNAGKTKCVNNTLYPTLVLRPFVLHCFALTPRAE